MTQNEQPIFCCTARASNRDIAPLVSNVRRILLLSADHAHRETGDRMGVVMIKCPDTGRDIPTGLVADRESFSATPVFFGRTWCPLCQTHHEWFAQQAWVCEAEPVERLERQTLS